MKSANGTPITLRPPRPSATVKMARYSKVVIGRRPDGLHLDLEEPPDLLDIEGPRPPQLTPLSTGSPGAKRTQGC